MRNTFIVPLLFFIILLITLVSCQENKTTASAEIREISVRNAHEMLAENPDVLVIDVRRPGEFDGPLGHIEGAVLKPLQEIEDWVSEIEGSRDKEILLVCRSGNRSSRAAAFLREQGFEHLYNLQGGMIEWNQQNYPVVKKE